MKKIQILCFALLVSLSSFANNSNPKNSTDKIKPNVVTAAISKLLEKPSFEVNEEINTTVSIMLNNENELVVLSVDSENEVVENYIKGRLNYQKLSAASLAKNKSYDVPVRIVTE